MKLGKKGQEGEGPGITPTATALMTILFIIFIVLIILYVLFGQPLWEQARAP
jgi:hypothetical protein